MHGGQLFGYSSLTGSLVRPLRESTTAIVVQVGPHRVCGYECRHKSHRKNQLLLSSLLSRPVGAVIARCVAPVSEDNLFRTRDSPYKLSLEIRMRQ